MHEGLDRADVDDPPLAPAQLRKKGMRDVEDAIKVDGHDVVPVLDHRRGLRAKGMAAIDAGIVDEDRHLPDAFADVLSKPAAGLGVGDVEAEAPGSTAGGGD